MVSIYQIYFNDTDSIYQHLTCFFLDCSGNEVLCTMTYSSNFRLVFVTGCFWYIFDMIFTYPYHVASAFLVISVYSYISSMRRRPSIQVSPGREFKQLNDRVVGVEKKTDMIQNKIDRLTELIEKVDLN